MLRSWIGYKNYFITVFQHPNWRIQRLRPSLACLPPGLLENRIGKEQ
jgi:hypothetical protein